MAKVISTEYTITLSKLVKNNADDDGLNLTLDEGELETLQAAIESLVNDETIIVEVATANE